VDDGHPDLQGQVIDGFNCIAGDKNYKDDNGHGTHVAGTIAAKLNDAGVVGVAYDAKILAIKVLDAQGSGTYDDIVKGIQTAIDWAGPNGEKVNVISMSLGGPADIPALHAVVKRAVDSDILVVCAAGNDGDGKADTDEKSYPGDYPEVVQVGACDSLAYIASFSNSNDEVDLVAPGVGIQSTYLNNGYAKLSGTSMATPHASAATVLVALEWEAKYRRAITEAELYAQLVKKTELLPGQDPKEQGNGLIQLAKGLPVTDGNPWDDITVDQAVRIIAATKFPNGEPISDSPEFWLNLAFKYQDDPDSDFRFVGLQMRKFAAYLQGN
jgi:major intracellular serine protease